MTLFVWLPDVAFTSLLLALNWRVARNVSRMLRAAPAAPSPVNPSLGGRCAGVARSVLLRTTTRKAPDA